MRKDEDARSTLDEISDRLPRGKFREPDKSLDSWVALMVPWTLMASLTKRPCNACGNPTAAMCLRLVQPIHPRRTCVWVCPLAFGDSPEDHERHVFTCAKLLSTPLPIHHGNIVLRCPKPCFRTAKNTREQCVSAHKRNVERGMMMVLVLVLSVGRDLVLVLSFQLAPQKIPMVPGRFSDVSVHVSGLSGSKLARRCMESAESSRVR